MVVRKTIKDMQDLAKKQGGKCLSKEYVNNYSKLKWLCKVGHEWCAIPLTVGRGHWCPYCGGTAPLSLGDMCELAKRRGGKCLSKKYCGALVKLEWVCAKGHKWMAKPVSVKGGTWCPICVGRNKTIEDMRVLAKKRGGVCLSKKYVNNQTKLRWRCKKGHVWQSIPMRVVAGKWCPYCAGFHKTIKDMQLLAKEKGGVCLSKVYVKSDVKLRWRCGKGHEWEAKPNSIKSGTWCPFCARMNVSKHRFKRSKVDQAVMNLIE